MSVYNGEPFLSGAIESILLQTFRDFEFIIINDGSTDNSLETIQHYASQDSRIVSVNQENIGLTKSLNKGIALSKGEFIARQDADDLSVSTRFEKQLPWVAERGYDLCCSRTWLLEKHRSTPRISYWIPKGLMMLKQNPFIHGTYMLRKKCLHALGGYDERYHYAQDYELMTRWLGSGYKVKFLWECLYQTRQTYIQISQSKRLEQEEFGKQIRQLWRERLWQKSKSWLTQDSSGRDPI